jgi:hypothetical protein
MQITTEMLRYGARDSALTQEEKAVISDRGLESFEIRQHGQGFHMETKGEREGDNLVISINSDAIKGQITIDVKAFDLSVYELLVMELDELREQPTGTFRLFDPEDLDIYDVRYHSTGRQVRKRGRVLRARDIVLNIEGLEMNITVDEEGDWHHINVGNDLSAVMCTEEAINEKKRRLRAR